MSGDDKSMDDILKEIREIVAEDEKESPKNPLAEADMSMSEILKEIREIVAEDEGGKMGARPGKRDIRIRRKAMLSAVGGAAMGAVLAPFGSMAAGVNMPMPWLLIGLSLTPFALPLAITARPENGRQMAILIGAGFAMTVAAFSAFGMVLYQALPANELVPVERLAVQLLAGIAALTAGLAGWFAIRWATLGESLWKQPAEDTEGEAG